MQKRDHCSTPYTEINSKCIKDLNIKPETIKLPGENMGGDPLDISLGGDYLD